MRRTISFAALLSLSLLAAGCADSPSVSQVRWEIQRRFPEARFEREVHFSLGRITLGLLRGLVRMVPGEVEGQRMLKEIRRVEVATYKVSSLPDLGRIEGSLRFEERLADEGWTVAVKAREDDSRAWVFVRGHEDGSLRNLFVVDLDGSELTLVRVDGRLERVVAEAIADRPREAVETLRGEDESSDDDSSDS